MGEAAGGLFVDAAAFGFAFAGVHEGAEEGAGGDDDGAGVKGLAGFEGNSCDARQICPGSGVRGSGPSGGGEIFAGTGTRIPDPGSRFVREEAVDDAWDDREVGAVAAVRRSCWTLAAYWYLSAWARGDWTAGPLERLSMRNWIPVASMARAMRPPRASISRTIWPLARPPMAGLQDMRPMARGSMVTRATLPFEALRMWEAAHAASVPAWPPPMMLTSK